MSVTDLAAWQEKRSAPRQRLYASKSALTTVAGRLSSLWASAPGAGAAPTSPVSPTKALAGSMRQMHSQEEMQNSSSVHRVVGVRGNAGQPGRLVLIDRLGHQAGLSGTVTTAQVTNLPTAALTRFTTGDAVEAALEIYSVLGTTATTFTCSYTNQSGGAVISPASVIGGTGFREVGRFLPIPLAVGDSGVRAVSDVDLAATTGTAGNFGVTLFRRLLSIGVQCPGPFDWDPLVDGGGNAPEVLTDACLQWLWLAQSATTGGFEATVLLAED